MDDDEVEFSVAAKCAAPTENVSELTEEVAEVNHRASLMRQAPVPALNLSQLGSKGVVAGPPTSSNVGSSNAPTFSPATRNTDPGVHAVPAQTTAQASATALTAPPAAP